MNKLSFVIAILILEALLGCAQQTQVQPIIPSPPSVEVTQPPQPSTEIPITAILKETKPKIAFVRDLGGDLGWDIFTADADGSNIVNITNSPSQDLWPTWSPDGTQIAFEGIYVMDADGGNRTFLGGGVYPAWSPNGTKIAFSSLGDLFTMNTDGTSKSPILPILRRQWDTYSQVCPSWFPDSKRVAYASNGMGYWEIFEVTVNNNLNIGILGADTSNSKKYPIHISGGGLRFPTDNIAYHNLFPVLSVSPDGGTIAFDYYNPVAFKRDIYLFDIETEKVKCLTCEASTNCYFPTWSPDGLKIAFTMETSKDSMGHVGTDIYVMDTDGGNPTLLIKNGMFPSWQR